MREQLEKLLESGQGLSNNFKFLLVAIISFSLGVMATSFFETRYQQEISQTLEKNDTQTSRSQPRKPFFIKVKEESKKIIENISQNRENSVDAPIATQSDFINLREKVEKFQDALDVQLKMKFKSIFQREKDPRDVLAIKAQSQTIDMMFLEKELFYRADFTEELSGSKIVIFFNYYNCDSKPVRLPVKLIDICYSLNMYNLKKDQWSQTNISSSAQGFLWNDGLPYSYVGLSGLGDFSKDTSANLAVVPVPNGESSINFLRFINGQFSWVEGAIIKWNVVGPKDLEKFERWSHDYNQRHSSGF